MKPFAMQVRVGRLDNVHCSFGRAGVRLSLWICASLMMCSLLLCRFGSNVGADLSHDGQVLLNFTKYNLDMGYLGECQADVASWNASEDTPCGWIRVFCNADSAVHRLDFSACSLAHDFVGLWILNGLPSLQELDLSSNPALSYTDYNFINLVSLSGLTWLDVSKSWAGLFHFGELGNLQFLYAGGGSGILDSQFGIPSLEGLRELKVLSLADNNLKGGIPEDVSNLTQLMSLDLSHNFLQGSIPNLEGLTRLTHLSLTSNNISGEVPGAPNLQYLDAAQNSFTNFTNSFFQIHPALQWVNLSRNQFGRQVPDFAGLINLQVLDLSWNDLHGPIPSGLPNLTHLDLSHNNLSGPIPPDFRIHRPVSSSNGGWVDLSGNGLNGSIPATLLYDGAPGYVNLSRNSLVGSIPDAPLDNGGSLQQRFSLDLSENQLQGPLPATFNESIFLFDVLWVQNNQLSGDLIPLLTDLMRGTTSSLTLSIRLQGNRFTGDLTKLLDAPNDDLVFGVVWDLSHNNFNMIPSEKFPNPLQGMLEHACNENSYSSPEEIRLAGSDLMGIPLPDRLNCLRPQRLKFFQILDLASCNLSGTVPDALFNINMPGLTFLNLSHNRLSGPIPGRLPVTLGVLDLGNTSVEGNMPAELFTGLPSLLHFNASHNKLSGPIPDSFPRTLQVLDLSNNYLSGELPGTLFFALPNLEYINLSGNNLTGPIPDGLPPALFNQSTFADNPGLCGGPLPACKIKPAAAAGFKVWVLVAAVVAAVLVCAASCLFSAWRWRVYSKKHQQDADLIATLLERETVTVMPLRELRKATSNFSESAQIGAGGFGTVYSGQLADGTAVAIKKSKREGSPEYKQQFLNEVRILSGVSHRHLVKLLGCSMENKIALLVFEFVPNGTLKEHLQRTRQGFSPLSWRQRLLIALQTSDALAYLHSAADPPIFHRDVKSCNILLDDDLNAKVADFGISKLAPSKAATHVSTVAIQGTRGYIDPEYYSSFQLTPRSDVYSFGVVLLELISSKPAIDFARGYDATSLVALALSAMERGEWQELIDPVLADTHSSASGRASIASVAALAVRCLAPRSRERPEMKEVRNELQTLFFHWDTDASVQSDDVRHSVQPQNENARGDVDTSYGRMSLLSSHSSLWNTSSTSYTETEMQPL